MEHKRFAEVTEVIPELTELTAAASLMWISASTAAPNQYPGFRVEHDGERAAFTMHRSPTIYDRLSLFRDEDGVWTVEEQRQRPTVETEGFGQFVRSTSRQSLIPGERAQQTIEISGPATGGEFALEAVSQAEQGLDVPECERLLGLLRTIRGEAELPTGRMPRVRGWLSKLGLIRP